MPISKRRLTLPDLVNNHWRSIFDSEKNQTSLVLRDNYCFELNLTHRDLRPTPSLDPEAQDRIWDSSQMIPYYFKTSTMKRELERLSQGISVSVRLTASGGIGDSCTARTAIKNEWLRFVFLPTDWPFETQREVEISWITGPEKRIKNRYRRSDTSRTIAGQMPAEYWGQWRLESTKTVLTVPTPFPIKVIRCVASAHLEDEYGVATSNPLYTTRVALVGQLENGIVLWWHYLSDSSTHEPIVLPGEYVTVGSASIHVSSGAGSSSWKQ